MPSNDYHVIKIIITGWVGLKDNHDLQRLQHYLQVMIKFKHFGVRRKDKKHNDCKNIYLCMYTYMYKSVYIRYACSIYNKYLHIPYFFILNNIFF